MKQFMKLGVILIFILLQCAVLIFLPEYMTGKVDSQYMDRLTLYARDISADTLSALSLSEKLEILSGVAKKGIGNRSPILSVYSYDDLMKSDRNLLSSLDSNIKELEKANILPVSSKEIDWKSSFAYADLYNLSLPENPENVLLIWNIVFYSNCDDLSECYYIVDADTYQIYEGELREWTVSEYIHKIYELAEESGENLENFWEKYWLEQYGSYLAGDDLESCDIYWVVRELENFAGCLNIDKLSYSVECAFMEAEKYYDADGMNREECGEPFGIFWFGPMDSDNWNE